MREGNYAAATILYRVEPTTTARCYTWSRTRGAGIGSAYYGKPDVIY
jgi:hypothetical protein